MDRVLDRLWIGSAEDLTAPLGPLGFVAVVDLRDGPRLDEQGVEVFALTNRDGDPWAPEQVAGALAFIDRKIEKGRVLVACVAGISRSASIVIGYLVRCGWDPPSAHAHVKRARPQILPWPVMLASALRAVCAGP